MINEFTPVVEGISVLLPKYKTRLENLDTEVFYARTNGQGRTIKQIIGHMIDSASNNIHRIVHLQHRQSPLEFPNYATEGNNDRWIAIQNYQSEKWQHLLELWYYIHLHIIHVIGNIDPAWLNQEWKSGPDTLLNLREMVVDFLRHFKLHLAEIDDLINE